MLPIQSSILWKHDIPLQPRWENDPEKRGTAPDSVRRYKDLLRVCPHHGFTELHQLDTFYNALNPADQDSLNAAAGGNLLERCTQDVLTIIKNKSKVRNSRNKSIVSQVKSCDANSNSSEIAELTIAVNQQTSACLAAGGIAFPELRDNIQGYVSAAAVNYNQGNPVYRPPEKVKRINEANMKAMQTQINMVKNELRNEMKNSIQASLSNQTNEIKNMMASLLQMKTASTLGSGSLASNTVANPKGELKVITTRSGIVLDGPVVPNPPTIINPEEDERVEETLTDLDLSEYTIKVPPPLVQKYKPSSQREYIVHQRDPLHLNIPYPSRMLKQKQQEKDKVQIHKFWQMFKQLHINITLADALILTPKPFLRTARALIHIHGDEMILRDGDERLTLNMRHDTSSYYNQPQKESINLINIFNNSSEDFLEDLFSNQPSGNPTFSSHSELTSPKVQDDVFDLEGGNLHINITLADALILTPKYQKMLKALLSNKKKLQELANAPLNENCSTVILKKLPEKLRDPGKFLIPCGF
nr:reverse transcriptase domain-containing protein [Tanacetum cinerariifolium]